MEIFIGVLCGVICLISAVLWGVLRGSYENHQRIDELEMQIDLVSQTMLMVTRGQVQNDKATRNLNQFIN